jgi:hypothetical protein
MKKLVVLSVLLLTLALAPIWSTPAMANPAPPCDEICADNPATRCSCPGTVHNVTCGTWQTVC